jgi:hypothetical protein
LSETTTDHGEYTEADFEAEVAEAQDHTAPHAQDTEAAPEGGDVAPKPQQRSVPLGELLAERKRAQAAVEEARQLREMTERGNARLEQLIASMQPKPPAEPAPDLNTDPVGYFQRQNAELARQVQELAQFKQQFETQGQRATQEQQFYAAYHAQAAEFQQTAAPDLGDAMKHLAASLRQDYQAVGLSPAEAQEQIDAQERFIVARAMREGRNPVEAMYSLAKARGYAGAKPPQNGQARMQAMQAGQAAARTTAGPARGDRFAGLTVETLANMSEAEFSRVPADLVDRLLRGGG